MWVCLGRLRLMNRFQPAARQMTSDVAAGERMSAVRHSAARRPSVPRLRGTSRTRAASCSTFEHWMPGETAIQRARTGGKGGTGWLRTDAEAR